MNSIDQYVSRLATEKQHAQALVREGANQLRPLNHDLATETPASDGVVLFGVDTSQYPGKAAALVTPDKRHFGEFGPQTIDRRFVELGATALGDDVARFNKNPEASKGFSSSRLNPSWQLVRNYPIFIDGRLVAVAEFAASPARNNHSIGIDETELDMIVANKHSVLRDVARGLTEVPVNSFELGPPTTPNAYIIRWDIRESTRLATGKDQGKLIAYKRALIQGFRKLLEPFDASKDEEGDGQNIVIYLPDTIHHDDTTSVHMWGQQHLPTLLKEMQELQHALATTLYPELNTTIRLSVDLGHVTDQDGSLDSDGFSRTAKEMKQRPAVPVTYTERASFLESAR